MANAVYGNVIYDEVFTIIGALLGVSIMILRALL